MTVQSKIEVRISQSWQMLAGSELAFSSCDDNVRPDASRRHFVVPLSFEGEPQAAAVVLEISEDHARMLASAMFGVSVSELSESDIKDACGELCNVLSACVGPAFSRTRDVEVGLPRCLKAEDLREMFTSSNLDGCFEAHDAEGGVTVFLLDPARVPGAAVSGG